MRALLTLILINLPLALWATPKKLELKGQIKFISDAPVERIVGTAEGFGQLSLDFEDLSGIKGEIEVPVKSMKTGNAMRDAHLYSATWLDAEGFPKISFSFGSVKVLSIEEKGAIKLAKLEAAGRFKLHGVEIPLTAPVQLKWKEEKVKASFSFQIKLADYQIKGKSGIVGSKVGELIDISGSLKGRAK